jgi:hypothetical protein
VPLAHDGRFFERLLVRAKALEPELRAGSMFGCPAAFVGRKLAFCVFGAKIGAKVPEAYAGALVASGVVKPFQPYGKKKMREWIALSQTVDDSVLAGVLDAALGYARELELRDR